ncbi:MAG TPA: DoxX family protein [Chlamydiales bacterium]|nr:DoxX family protein [Chlamydiales bacterium]
MRFESSLLHFIDRLYSLIIKIAGNLQSLFLLYMRLTWGYQLMHMGWAKLRSIDTAIAYFASLHFSHPVFDAYLAGAIEFLGGCCLFFGFASRIACIPIALLALAALSTAHAPHISNFRFLLQPLSLVRQTPYPFLLTSLIIFIFGPGRISIDGWLKRWSEKQPKY